jgi:poly(beta-D-mannuronate) lyase
MLSKGHVVLSGRRLIVCALAVSLALPLAAAEVVVTSAKELENAAKTASPGDTLILQDGTYTDQELKFSATGTAEKPITLRAQTPGKAILTGGSTLRVSGSHLVVDSLTFQNIALTTGHILRLGSDDADTSHVRITNCAFINNNPPDPATRYMWLSAYGTHHRIDHNHFAGQNHLGVTLVVWPKLDRPSNIQIDHNHFAGRPLGTGNGFETIRLGTSQVQSSSSKITVENNLFEKTDGEIEIISNKTCDNTIRNNTFLNAAGTITLRHGRRALVENNYFNGQGNPNSGGIRVIGPGHIIRGNHFENLGNNGQAVISLMTAQSDFDPAGKNNNGYEAVHDVLIENNTLATATGPLLRLDGLYKNRALQDVRPRNVTLTHNTFYNPTAPIFDGVEGEGFVWSNNTAIGPNLGTPPSAGVTHQSTGQPPTSALRPLTPADVGPKWMRPQP